jgi:hypothetical protein
MKDIIVQEEWCHYSDLPSPISYTACTDYDGMGNQGRFPKKPVLKVKTDTKSKWYMKKRGRG